MNVENNKFTRREFLKLTELGLKTIIASNTVDIISEIKITLPPTRPAGVFAGIGANGLGFKDQTGINFDQTISTIKKYKLGALREMLGDEVEPLEVGDFNTEPIERIINLADYLATVTPAVSLEVDIFNFFNLFWADSFRKDNKLLRSAEQLNFQSQENLTRFNKQTATSRNHCLSFTQAIDYQSAYQVFVTDSLPEKEKWRSFFTNKNTYRAFTQRIKFILTHKNKFGQSIAQHPNISLLSFNEPPQVPEIIPFFSKLRTYISTFCDKPVTVGLKEVNEFIVDFAQQVSGLDILAVHLYDLSPKRILLLEQLSRILKIPIMIQEFGLGTKFNKKELPMSLTDQDLKLASFYHLLFKMMTPSYFGRTHPTSWYFRFWRLGFLVDCNGDSFNIIPEQFPLTFSVIEKWNNYFLAAVTVQSY